MTRANHAGRNIALFLSCVFGAVLMLTGCPVRQRAYQRTELVMDTVVTVTAYGRAAPDAVERVMSEFARFDALWNRFDPSSEVSRINANAGREPVKVHEDTRFIIKKSLVHSELSGGAFDITIGPLVDLWGFTRGERRVPASDEIRRAQELVDYRDVVVDDAAGTVFLRRPGMSLDLGAVAKGYATDRAAAILKSHGITQALINAGGNVYAIGSKPDRTNWTIGVQHPRRPGQLIASMRLIDMSAVTSGDYERFFEVGGVRYHHIIDPSTGSPARGGLTAITVVSRDSAEADMLSTSVFILGKSKGIELIRRIGGTEAVFVEEGNIVTITDGLKGQVHITR